MKVIIIETGEDFMDPVDDITIEGDSVEDAIDAVEARGYTVIRDEDGGCCEVVGVTDGDDDYIAITVATPLDLEEVGSNGLISRYAVSGTPSNYDVAHIVHGVRLVATIAEPEERQVGEWSAEQERALRRRIIDAVSEWDDADALEVIFDPDRDQAETVDTLT